MKKLTTEYFIKKAITEHGNKYDYSKVNYINDLTKVTIICPTHGDFEQKPGNHLRGNGCQKCSIEKLNYSKRLTTLEFIEKAKLIHSNKYNYNKVNYINAFTKVTITCPNHGDFEQLPVNHLQGNGCDYCRKEEFKLNHPTKFTKEEFIQKAGEVHDDKYDYSKVIYINNYTPVIILCHKHGEFEQFPYNHLRGAGCSKCRNDIIGNMFRSDINEFIDKAKEVHNDRFDYSKVDYMLAHVKINIICKEHGEFYQSPAAHLQGQGCPICSSSKGELAIKAILDKHGIEAKQEWKIPDEDYLFRYDFYLPQLNMFIEFHGIQHYEHVPFFHKTYEIFKEKQKDDIFKVELAKLKGIPLIEINYKQFKHMTKEELEKYLMAHILNTTT